MMIRSMVESTWAEDVGQFLYHLDPDIRKITRSLKKMESKMINSVLSSLTKLPRIYIYIYSVCMCAYVCAFIYIYAHMHTTYVYTHTHTHTHTHICKSVCVYIYIYIYIVIQRQTFVVPQLFSVARHIECFKLGLNPT